MIHNRHAVIVPNPPPCLLPFHPFSLKDTLYLFSLLTVWTMPETIRTERAHQAAGG